MVLKYASSLVFINDVFVVFKLSNSSSLATFIFVAFINITPSELYNLFVASEYCISGIIKSGEFDTILLESVSLIIPISNGFTPYNANILLTFGKSSCLAIAAFNHKIFPPLLIYSVIAFVATSSKSFSGDVITNVLQSSGTFPVDNISSVSTSFTSFCKYIFKYCIPLVSVNELYPFKKYTFGNSSTDTDLIAAVNFSSATFIDSYVVVSCVYKSLVASTL